MGGVACVCMRVAECHRLLLSLSLAVAAQLLSLEVLVKHIESLLVAGAGASDSEHTLARVIVRSFSNADPGAGGATNLLDLGASTTDDASNHISRNGDVLGLELLAVLANSRGRGRGSLVETTARTSVATERGLGEVSAVAGASERARSSTVVTERAHSAVAGNRPTHTNTTGGTDRGVIEDGALAALPVVDEALANLPNSHTDGVGISLDLDDALGGLRKHLLLGDHAAAGNILNVLDLESLATDDSTHLVVGDQKADRYVTS